MEARGDGATRRASDGALRRRRHGAGSQRQCGRRRDDWRRHIDLGTDGRPLSNDEQRGYGVNIHINRLNETIGDGDGVFTWKELVMGHWIHFPLVPADMGLIWIQGLELFLA